MNLAKNWYKKPKLIPTRNGYGIGLLKAGKNKNIVVLCADLTESTRSHLFKEKYPERFIEIGVAEQNLATVAAGMAKMGKIPFIASYATFSPGRNNEQIRTTISYNNFPVKIVGAHAGISVGPDGATHQALEDIALMRTQPNMQVIVPCDAIEAEKATIAISKTKSPTYIRLGREKTPVFTTQKTPFKIGRAELLLNYGNDILIIGCGAVLHEAMLAAKELQGKINCKVLNCHTIKPLDKKTILKLSKQCKAIITIEEHQTAGGLGSTIAELLSQEMPKKMKIIGIQDHFGESGKPDELLTKFGLKKTNIIKAIKELK